MSQPPASCSRWGPCWMWRRRWWAAAAAQHPREACCAVLFCAVVLRRWLHCCCKTGECGCVEALADLQFGGHPAGSSWGSCACSSVPIRLLPCRSDSQGQQSFYVGAGGSNSSVMTVKPTVWPGGLGGSQSGENRWLCPLCAAARWAAVKSLSGPSSWCRLCHYVRNANQVRAHTRRPAVPAMELQLVASSHCVSWGACSRVSRVRFHES